MQLYLRMWVYLPRPGQFKRKEAKEQELPPVEKSRQAPVQTGHPGPFLVPWTSFYDIPARSIQLWSCHEDKGSQPANPKSNDRSLFIHLLGSLETGRPRDHRSTQVRCTPDVSACGGLLLPLTHWMLQCTSSHEKQSRGGGMEGGGGHSVHHRQRNTRDHCLRPKLPQHECWIQIKTAIGK